MTKSNDPNLLRPTKLVGKAMKQDAAIKEQNNARPCDDDEWLRKLDEQEEEFNKGQDKFYEYLRAHTK